jgi:hypothetical protein
MSGYVNSATQTMPEWLENIRIIVNKKNWSDSTARQIFMLRTTGSLYRFLFKELNIETLTLDQILDKIHNRFVTVDQDLIDNARLRSIEMLDDETVPEYWERFDAVACRTPMSDFDKMTVFINGLRTDIKHGVIDHFPDSLTAAYNAAQRVETWHDLFIDQSEHPNSPVNNSSTNWQQSQEKLPFLSPTSYHSSPKTSVF